MKHGILLAGSGLALLLAGRPAMAQTNPLRGQVVDSAGQPVAGAVVDVRGSRQSTTTDSRGSFRLDLPNGEVQLRLERLGFERRFLTVTLPIEGDSLTITLQPAPVPLASLVVTGGRERTFTQTVSPATVRNVPPLGEPDVFRAMTVLPFVTQPNDLKGQIHLAGGASDETAIYLDGHPMQNPFHLLGLLGAFNLAALDHADVLMHHLPASRGGGLSGIIDLESARATRTPRYDATVGLLSSSLTAARAAGAVDVLASGRITYIDRLAALAGESNALLGDIPLYGFADALVGVAFSRTGLTAQMTAYVNRDSFRERDLMEVAGYRPLVWGESLIGVRLERNGGQSVLRARASINRATSELDERPAGRHVTIDTRRDHTSAGLQYLYTAGAAQWSAGADVDRFDNAQSWNARGRTDELFTALTPPSFEGAARLDLLSLFGEGVVRPTERTTLSAGLRFSHAAGNWWLAPRAAASLSTGAMRIEAAVNRRWQFHTQLEEPPEGSIAAPIFLLERPRRADVAALSFEWRNAELPNALPVLRVEGFGKRYVDRTVLASPDSGEAFPDFLRVPGNGLGISVTMRKAILGAGWFQGSYVYQRTREEIDGSVFPTSWDAPHAATVMTALPIGSRWMLNIVYQAHTGRATTPVIARVFAGRDDEIGARANARYILGERNSIRVPAYHRVDLGVRRSWTRGHSHWALSAQVLNVLFRQNPIDYDWQQYYARVRDGRDFSGGGRAGLPIIPSVNLEVRW